VCLTHVMNQKLTNISVIHQPDKNMLGYLSILLKIQHLTYLSNYEMISNMMQIICRKHGFISFLDEVLVYSSLVQT